MYEKLSTVELVNFGLQYEAVKNTLPDLKELLKMNRGYLSNVIYTLVGQPFKDFVDERIQQRNQAMQEKRNLLVHLDSEVARVFA